jgi:hypothetical protein
MNFVKSITLLILVVFFAQFCGAQTAEIVVTQDAKFEIFTGTTDEAKQTLSSFRKEFVGVESTIVFNTPNYRVIAGNFKTRIDAERNLILIKKVYKNALLIRPRR